MATTKVINDLIDLNQSGSTSGLKGCAGTTAQQPTDSFDIDYLIVGGGGAATTALSGGGGAGGLLTGTTSVASGSSVVLTVGEGGTTTSSGYTQESFSGNDSGFAGLRAVGGGGAPRRNYYGEWAIDGGSGSGASIGTGDSASSQADGGSGISGQGNNGGANAAIGGLSAAGGGGGAGAVGTAGSSGTGGGGGIGSELSSFITYTDANSAGVGEVSGTNVYFAGGGGASGYSGVTHTQTAGTGGLGGGGNGNNTSGDGEDGAANTGGGAGGGDGTSGVGNGGSGGSGVVILKYDNTVVNSVTVDGTLVAPTTTMTTSTCNYPTGAGCQALYQFNSNINDTCGNYNGVSSSNITYAAGQYGNAAQLNGSSSNIFLPDNSNFDLSASQSMSFWVNSNNSGNAWLFQKGNPESYGLWTNGSIFYFTLYAPGYFQLTTSTITLNTWYHVVLTVDAAGTGYILYLNGALADSNTFGAINTNTSDVRIGSYQGSSFFWNGAIDQLRYFNTTLSSSQVTELYNEVAYQTKFTNGTTDTIVFKEGSGNITFNKADAEPGAEIGMLRYNTTLGQMEHYTATGYKDFTNL
jgi:hypothetical protein